MNGWSVIDVVLVLRLFDVAITSKQNDSKRSLDFQSVTDCQVKFK